ncbi:MAG: hypothetical protein ACLTW9_00700 [Enterocloster sp.]
MAASLFGMVLNHQMSTSILNSIKRLTDAARETERVSSWRQRISRRRLMRS